MVAFAFFIIPQPFHVMISFLMQQQNSHWALYNVLVPQFTFIITVSAVFRYYIFHYISASTEAAKNHITRLIKLWLLSFCLCSPCLM